MRHWDGQHSRRVECRINRTQALRESRVRRREVAAWIHSRCFDLRFQGPFTENGVRGCIPYQEQYIRASVGNRLSEKRDAGCDFVLSRWPIAGRSATHDIGDTVFTPTTEATTPQQVIEALSRGSYKASCRQILRFTGCFANR